MMSTPLENQHGTQKMEVWKIIFLSKWVICRFHDNLPGCNFSTIISFISVGQVTIRIRHATSAIALHAIIVEPGLFF